MSEKEHSNLFRLSPRTSEVDESPDNIGAALKKERLNQGLSLEEASGATKINVRVLRALEENDRDNLPAEAFVRGFITLYAGYLDLDAEKLLALYQQQQEADKSRQNTNLKAHEIVKLHPGSQKIPFSFGRLVLAIISIVVLLALLYLGYAYYFSLDYRQSRIIDRALSGFSETVQERNEAKPVP